MIGVHIRPLTPDDRAEWARLWEGYLAFYETRLNSDIHDITFTRLLDTNHPAQNALVAEYEGRLVGLVHYIYHAHNWRAEDVCYLQDLFTDPGLRGRGVARALIKAVYSAADANGTPNVYWLTQDFNHTARRLYDKIAQKTPFIKYQR